MSVAVIYKSKYGFTKTYAQWLAEDLKAELLSADKVKPEDLQKYDVIIYGGGLYAGGVSGIELLTKNFDAIKGKSLYLFTVGAADVSDKDNTDHIRSSLSKVLTPSMQEAIKIYHLRGGMSYSNMGPIHRTMMKMMMKMIGKKPENELRAEDKMMIETYGQDIDFTKREAVASIVNDVMKNIAI